MAAAPWRAARGRGIQFPGQSSCLYSASTRCTMLRPPAGVHWPQGTNHRFSKLQIAKGAPGSDHILSADAGTSCRLAALPVFPAVKKDTVLYWHVQPARAPAGMQCRFGRGRTRFSRPAEPRLQIQASVRFGRPACRSTQAKRRMAWHPPAAGGGLANVPARP